MNQIPSPSELSAAPASISGTRPAQPSRLMVWGKRNFIFLLVVMLPTLVTTVYMTAIASDQYVTEARFVVRSASQSNGSGASSLLGALIGGGGGGISGMSQGESYSVADYLESHDAVAALQHDLDIVGLYRRPGADFYARLWWARPPAERLLDYYQDMVSVKIDPSSGIVILKTYAFRPDDAQRIAERLLELAEHRVNNFSNRAQADTLAIATQEEAQSEKRVIDAEAALTNFRMHQQAIDPAKSAATLLTVIGALEGQMAAAKAQQAAQSNYLDADSPAQRALGDKIAALQAQIDTETARMTGGDGNVLAPVLAQYETLSLEKEFAEKEYAVALSSMESARMDALKQHMFVVRIVEPNLPELSTYPQRALSILSVFVTLLVSYGIGWLIYAGMKEHAA